MNPGDIEHLIDWWRNLGFHTQDEDENGNPIKWVVVCLFEVMFGGATLNCDWIDYDKKIKGAYLKGTEVGNLVGRDDVAIPRYF